MTALDADDVRAIVREELDAYDAARKEKSEISGSMIKATAEHHLEKMLTELDLPDKEREQLRGLIESMNTGLFG